jgi:hypothetical protein
MRNRVSSSGRTRVYFFMGIMRYYLLTSLAVLVVIGGWGCQGTPAVDDTSVLMTVGRREVHQDEFQRAYRVFKAAYGAEVDEDPSAERASIIRFIDQLADELVLMEYAQDVGVVISEEDLDRAVDDIRQDYPEGLFEQMLLETAVNFADWREALRVRLTIDRLVQQELAAKVRITEEDIAAYYKTHASTQPIPPSATEGQIEEQVDQLLVQQLRRQKTEEAYGPWIESIRSKYPVTIDQAVVNHILAESGIGEESRAAAH